MPAAIVHEQFGSCMFKCHDGLGRTEAGHFADGWIIAPSGRKISPMCRGHAAAVIEEYRSKLGEAWTFDESA